MWLITQTRGASADATTEAILAYTYTEVMLVLHTILVRFVLKLRGQYQYQFYNVNLTIWKQFREQLNSISQALEMCLRMKSLST